MDSSIEEEEIKVKPDNIVDSSDSEQISSVKSKPSVVEKMIDKTSLVPIHQDSLLDSRVIRELSKDSPNSFRTVTLDTEYDKLLHLLE